jgi:hypothetical protein
LCGNYRCFTVRLERKRGLFFNHNKLIDISSELEVWNDDCLPCGIINPLRAAGLIYTERQEAEPDVDNASESESSELTTISSDEVEKLLPYLQSHS